MTRKKPNKSQLIRDYKAKHPNARPVEIIKALKAHKVSAPLVYGVLQRASNGKANRGGNGLTLEALVAAKELANRLGGVEAARAALIVLEKLGA